MNRILIAIVLAILVSCNIENQENKREEILNEYQAQKEQLDKEIEELQEASKEFADDAQNEIESTLRKLQKERKQLTREAEKLKKASEEELQKALDDARKQHDKWLKEKKKQLN